MLRIERMKEEDCKKVVEWNKNQNKDLLYQWAGPRVYTYPLSSIQIEKRLNLEGVRIYKIMKNTDIIGTVELCFSIDKKSATICRFLLKENERGKGYGKQILGMLKDLAFGDMNLSKLSLCVFVFNHQAIKCYENAGFSIEHLKENEEDTKWNAYRMTISNDK